MLALPDHPCVEVATSKVLPNSSFKVTEAIFVSILYFSTRNNDSLLICVLKHY